MNPVSSSRANFDLQYGVAVQKKVLDSAKDMGKAAVQLIESSAAPAPSGSVGTKLNIVA